jgi:glycosyltransferase involved in cell wall biosynthesis/DNA-binding beta-propeller fold protein YncE
MKVAIGIPTYNRRQVVEYNARSLRSSRLPRDTMILVIDDASTDYDEAYLKAIYPEGTEIHRRSENSGGASFAARDLMMRLLETGADTVLLLDSDCIVSSGFLQKALELLPQTDGFLSLFNTTSHPEVGRCGPLVLKMSVGSAATMWRSQVAREMLKAVSTGSGFDWRFCNFLIRAGYKLFVVRDSLVQHIGYSEGQNSSFRNGDIGLGFSDDHVQGAYLLFEHLAFATQSESKLMQAQIDTLLKDLAGVKQKLEREFPSRIGSSIERLLGRSKRHQLAKDIVSGLYRRILLREPDESGFAGWVSGLRNGTVDLDAVLLGFLTSEEFKSNFQKFKRVYDSEKTSGISRVASFSQLQSPHPQIGTECYEWWKEPAPDGIAETVLVHVSEHSVLREIKTRSLVPKVVAGRRRFATCSGVAWFRDHHLAVVNLYGQHLRIYGVDLDDYGDPFRLRLLHEVNEGLAFPEQVAVSPDGSVLAISHSESKAHGISLHTIEANSPTTITACGMFRVGPAFHGLYFSPDSRYLAFTEIGAPGYVEVAAINSGACTCRLGNLYVPFKPKGVAFSRDGCFVVVTFASNVQPENLPTTSGGILAVHRFDAEQGMMEPEAVAEWRSSDSSFGAMEMCTILPALPGRPFRILAADQSADIVLAFDFDPQRLTLSYVGVFAVGLSCPHGLDASADGRFVAITNYGDDTLRIARVPAERIRCSSAH